MRASPAFLEIETTGVAIDRKRAEKLTDLYIEVRDTRLKELKEKIKWPEFNPASPRHRVELMFGEKFHAKKGLKLRPEGAVTLDLSPVKSTGKRSVMWKDALAKKFSDPTVMENFNPATDKETMGILASSEKNTWQIDVVKSLRDVSFLNQLLRTVLRPPSYTDQDDEVPELDESGDKVYEKGILSELHDDGRVRPHFLQAAETGRARCSKPNLQNWSKRREPDYMRIAGDKYKYPLRSIIVPAPGCVFIEADYSAAEVAGVAWMSGDPQLIEHARRSALPEDHPDYFDIHSNIAVRAFQLNCLPTKKGLKSIDKIALRTAAKAVFFGYLYGQGAESAARKAREEGADVTTQDAQALIDSLNSTYPLLAEFFDECRSRAIDPGWLRNCFGRYRRFSETFDRQVIGESQRQAMNFP
jgi:DNA polymerase I-like protein with 3'-5' exonuclease and polymerase domains